MGINPNDLNLIIEQAIQKALQTNQNTNNYYKNMNKHKKCSKCSILITTENYKKDRSVCKVCYNTNTLNLMKKRFGLLEENSSSNKDVSDIQDRSNKEDISNKQVRSRKQNSSNKQVRSRKQDTSSKQDSFINLKNLDPDCLMEKFTELYNSKYASIEEAQVACERGKEILNELLRVKAIIKRQYNTLYKKCDK